MKKYIYLLFVVSFCLSYERPTVHNFNNNSKIAVWNSLITNVDDIAKPLYQNIGFDIKPSNCYEISFDISKKVGEKLISAIESFKFIDN